jgi:hypothetical protein
MGEMVSPAWAPGAAAIRIAAKPAKREVRLDAYFIFWFPKWARKTALTVC